ncbi:MAG TPA: hypothetical protein VFW74_12185, partial [Acidimicrobiia bacterium]|nr:hypothetical protein [Acidimicrobiia bacterium]
SARGIATRYARPFSMYVPDVSDGVHVGRRRLGLVAREPDEHETHVASVNAETTSARIRLRRMRDG